MNIDAGILLGMVVVAVVIMLCLMWFNAESNDINTDIATPRDLEGAAVIHDNAVTTCKLPGGFTHSEEEAYDLKHALVSLMVYGGLPDDVVGEILDNVYAQEQEDFPGTDEHLIWLLPNLFDFDRTPQGYNYWIAIDCQPDLLMEGRDPQVEAWIREALE